MIDRIARWITSQFLRRMPVGQLVIVEDGHERRYGSGPPAARVCVRSPRMWRKLLRGSRGLAESYVDGLWDSPDPTAVIRLAARNVHGLDSFRRRLAPVRAPIQYLRHLIRTNTRTRSRKSIAAHYDLGNELFALMLDPTTWALAAAGGLLLGCGGAPEAAQRDEGHDGEGGERGRDKILAVAERGHGGSPGAGRRVAIGDYTAAQDGA